MSKKINRVALSKCVIMLPQSLMDEAAWISVNYDVLRKDESNSCFLILWVNKRVKIFLLYWYGNTFTFGWVLRHIKHCRLFNAKSG